MTPTLSIIIVNYNERERLRSVLTALAAEFPITELETIVVDNDSHDGSAAMVKSDFPTTILIEPHANLMYGKGNNLGLARATGDWIMILNPDVAWEPGQLRRLVEWVKTKPGVDIAAPRLVYSDGRTQISAHRRFPDLWTVFVEYCLPLQQLFMKFGHHPHQLSVAEHQKTQQIAHATGACLLVRHSVIREVGQFDPEFTMYLEETDWQARMAAAGFQNWLFAEAAITHFGSTQKSFAQASRHYLWGLRRFSSKHWTSNQQAALPPAVMTATLISVVLLTILILPSYILGRAGQRVRHYTIIYLVLIGKILAWPRTAPTRS